MDAVGFVAGRKAIGIMDMGAFPQIDRIHGRSLADLVHLPALFHTGTSPDHHTLGFCDA
jgi:hypothetical protein